MRLASRSTLGLTGLAALAFAALALAYVSLVQPWGCNQTAHYALVKSLSAGSPNIDPYANETCDKSWYEGHYYATKAPGLAFALVPLHKALDTLGLVPASAMTSIWLHGLVGTVLPALILLLLVWRIADTFEPGLGLAAAILLGAATLVLPFATLLFAHALSTLLGFAAFALLWRERAGPSRPALVALAGLLAGLAVTTENPLVFLGIVLGAYAISRGPHLARGAAYAAGAVAGTLPFLAFNWWALGSPFRNVYTYWITTAGGSGHDQVGGATESGVFGIGVPSWREATYLLLSPRGLLVLTPVVALGILGAVLLYRRGVRAEALVILGVAAVYLAYVSGFFNPIGGDVPGPRYLIPTLPFLALGFGPAIRRVPLLALVLGVGSAAAMTLATVTSPMLGHEGTHVWLSHLRFRLFTHGLATLAGLGTGVLVALPFILLVCAALLAALLSTRPVLERADPGVRIAAAGTVAWAFVALAAKELVHAGPERTTAGSLAALVLLVAGVLLVVAAARGPRLALAGTLLLGVAAALAAEPAAALVAALVTAAVLAAGLAAPRPAVPAREAH